MTFELASKSDLLAMKTEIISEIQTLLKPQDHLSGKNWLKSNEVRALLHCSHGTLQNLRIRKTLNPSKIGGVWYYPAQEVYSLLNNGEFHD